MASLKRKLVDTDSPVTSVHKRSRDKPTLEVELSEIPACSTPGGGDLDGAV